ncbi:MAG: TSUP family transporter, partial [Pseudomonadota bacterium]
MLAAYGAGGIIKGGLGFGLPLVTLSITPLFVALDLAIVANAVVLPLINIVQIKQAGGLVPAFRRFLPLILPLALCLPLGVWLGTRISAPALTLALGIVIMVSTLIQVANPRLVLPRHLERPGAVVTGLAAGTIGGLTTVNGPLFVLYLVSLGIERRVMMA